MPCCTLCTGDEDGMRAYAGMELKLPGIRQRLELRHLPEDAVLKEVKVSPYLWEVCPQPWFWK